MKLNRIQIEQFGLWRNLDLSLENSRLNVIHGPNEAGKTTLQRFIRGLLYGFEISDGEEQIKHHISEPRSGSLFVEQDGQQNEIVRKSSHTGHEILSVIGGDEDVSGNECLSQLLRETDHKIFSHVFAIGLYELQKLATLQDADVTQYLFNVSLGSAGEILLAALEDLEQQQSRFINDKNSKGTLVEMLDHDRELSVEIESLKSLRTTHAKRLLECESLEAEIADLKQRNAGIQYQLRGHQFLEKIWPAWKQVADLNQELTAFSDLDGFPENGMERLNQLESELESVIQTRNALMNAIDGLKSEVDETEIDTVFQNSAETIRNFVSQYDQIAEISLAVNGLENEEKNLDKQLVTSLERLGPGWSLEQFESIKISPEDHQRIYASAWHYQSALAKQKRLRNRFQRISNSCQKKLGQLNEYKKQLAGISIEEAISVTRQRLHDLQELSRLRSEAREQEQGRLALEAEMERIQRLTKLPAWVSRLLGGLSLSGSIIACAGFLTGLVTNGIVGLLFGLAGLTGIGISWGVKSHHRRQIGEQLRHVSDALNLVTPALCAMRLKIDALSEKVLHPLFQTSIEEISNDSPESQNGPIESELISKTVSLLVELERWWEIDHRIGKRRRRLSRLRLSLRRTQRDVSEARQEWCRELTRVGLPESIQIQETFEAWQQILSVDELRRRKTEVREKLDLYKEQERFFRDGISQLDRKLGAEFAESESTNKTDHDLLTILHQWRDLLNIHQSALLERDELLGKMEELDSEADVCGQRLDQLTEQYADLLSQAGTTDRNEFEQRADLERQKQELLTLLSLAQSELQAVAETEPEMAVVEDDFFEYNSSENSQCIRVLKSELEDLENDRQELFESLGLVKARIQELESDRRLSHLRFERSLLQENLQQQLQSWLALQWAGKNLNDLKSNYERTRQPETLISAARYLKQLTNGRYSSIWVPLGEQNLMVDVDQGESFRVDQLSGGTREQLFLSIRFALIEQLRDQGIELPIILDDVIVNFDRARAEAVIEVLMQLTETGQQILFFTCHEHLARLFSDRGAHLIRLEEQRSMRDDRRAG